jgi:protein O-mannosyl-transferase
MAIVVLIGTGLMANAYVQTSFWRDSETMWNQALAHTSNNYVAHTHLADALMKRGRLDEAIAHLRQALEISDYPTAHYNLGYALASKGNWADAIVSFQAAIRFRPNYSQAHSNLAVSLSKLGRSDEALAEFREALRLDENYRDAHYNLAILMLQLGRRDEAVAHFREALRLKPDDTVVRDQLRELGVEQ